MILPIIVQIWDIAKKRVKRVFEGHQQEIYSLNFSKNGRLIVSGSGDRTARIWDMETGMQKVLEINEPEGIDAGVTSVAISPDGRLVAAGSLDTVVRIWEVQTGNMVERLKGHRDSVYSVAFTPDGKGIVSGSLDKTLKHWDITALVTGPARKEPLPRATTPTAVVPNPGGGATLAGVPPAGRGATMKEGGERGSVNTLNFTGHKDYVLSVAVSHDGQWVVSGSKDRGVQFWDQRTAQVQALLQGHKNSVISIDLSPAGGILATGSGDMQARLCELPLSILKMVLKMLTKLYRDLHDDMMCTFSYEKQNRTGDARSSILLYKNLVVSVLYVPVVSSAYPLTQFVKMRS